MNCLKFSKMPSGHVNINKQITENEDGVFLFFHKNMSPKIFLNLNWRLNDFIIRNPENKEGLLIDKFVRFRFDSHFNTVLQSTSYIEDDKQDLQNWCFIENQETFNKIESLLKNNQLPRLINTIPLNHYTPELLIPYIEDHLDHVRYGQLLIDDLILNVMGSKENFLLEVFLSIHNNNNSEERKDLISTSEIFFRAYNQVKKSKSFEEVKKIVEDLNKTLKKEKLS